MAILTFHPGVCHTMVRCFDHFLLHFLTNLKTFTNSRYIPAAKQVWGRTIDLIKAETDLIG